MKPESRMEYKRHELLADLSAHGTNILLDHGISEDVANQAALALADHLAQNWGGQNICFPKDYLYKLSERDLLIYAEFNGTNYDVLASKYQMTERGMRKLIDRVHRREMGRRQPQLFE